MNRRPRSIYSGALITSGAGLIHVRAKAAGPQGRRVHACSTIKKPLISRFLASCLEHRWVPKRYPLKSKQENKSVSEGRFLEQYIFKEPANKAVVKGLNPSIQKSSGSEFCEHQRSLCQRKRCATMYLRPVGPSMRASAPRTCSLVRNGTERVRNLKRDHRALQSLLASIRTFRAR